MTLENLIGKGLAREPTSKEEVQRFCARIATKLDDARNESVSLDSRFDMAYEALLQIGLAALRAHGLRPDSRGGHHVLALQTLNTTIGYPRDRIRLLDEFRRKRAASLYDGTLPTRAELDELIDTVGEVKRQFELWLQDQRPELSNTPSR